MKVPPLLELRLAAPSDAAQIQALCHQLGYSPSLAEVQLTLSRPSKEHAVIVASTADSVVGWIETARQPLLTSGDEALICGLVVDESHRGAGIGRRLVEAAEEWARASGAQTIRVRSRLSRERAHRFYLDLGYVEYKRQAVFRKSLE